MLVACSGGPDSIALASLIDRLARERDDCDVVLAHVNHGVRTSSDQDECVVLSAGARLGRRVAIARPRLARDDEAALREARYAALAELATELRRSGLPYALDPTNAELRYRRNALRPPLDALRAEFPHLDRAVARCAEIVRGELEGRGRGTEP